MTKSISLIPRITSAAVYGLRAARREFRAELDTSLALNELQQQFVEWNAERLNITVEESSERFQASASRFRGGHSGPEFRKFNSLTYDVFLPFFSDEETELYHSYHFHSRMHFLRMLSYASFEPDPATTRLIENFTSGQKVGILDFGCGLAQRSRWLAETLMKNGSEVTLSLADIPTPRKDFLVWLCAKDGIDLRFLECSQTAPIPELPQNIDICIATEFFEHVRDPIQYFDRFCERMPVQSWLITNVADHTAEYMHVSPNLSSLRHRITKAGFSEVLENKVFQKVS